MPSEAHPLVRLMRRNRRIRGEIAELFRDVRCWNEHNPQHPPIDPDPDGEMRRQLSFLERQEAELADQYRRLDRGGGAG